MKKFLSQARSLLSLLKPKSGIKQETVKTPEINEADKQEKKELDPQDLMTKLSERLEVPIEGEDGKWVLTFGNNSVFFQVVNNTFYIMSEVCSKFNKESEYETLLKANFIGRSTGGATLGIDEDSIMLSQIIYGGTDYRQFETHLANFVRVLNYWQGQLQKNSADE